MGRSRNAPLLVWLLLLAVSAGGAAPRAPAQQDDRKHLDELLALVYTPEPADLDGALAKLSAMQRQQRWSKDPAVRAGIAIATSLVAERTGDLVGIEAAMHDAERTAMSNKQRIVEAALGVTELVAGRVSKAARDRERLLGAALKAFEQAAKAGADSGAEDRWVDLYMGGQVLAELGREADALAAFRDALANTPKLQLTGHVHAAIARIMLGHGAWREAAAELREAARFAPGSPSIAIDLADALERGGDLAGAAQVLAPLAADSPAAARAFVRVSLPLGTTLDAVDILAKECGAADASADAFALRGEYHWRRGEAADAARDLNEAIKRDSFCGRAHAWLAEQALAKGEMQTSLLEARSAALLEPRVPARLDLLSRAMKAGGDEAGAAAVEKKRAALEAAIADARGKGRELPVETAWRRARSRMGAGRSAEALALIELALKDDPDDAAGLVLKTRALLESQPPRPADARSAVSALLDWLPRSHDANALSAAVAQLEGDEERARSSAQRAIQLEPSDALALRLLGGRAQGPGGNEISVPDELKPFADQLAAPDPIARASAADELSKNPIGIQLLLRQFETETEPFVVGAIALKLGQRHEKKAAAPLVNRLKTLSPIQSIARARIARALGRLGDSSVLFDLVDASRNADPDLDRASSAAVTELLSAGGDAGSIRFQRNLVESGDARKKALAPLFAERLAAGGARTETQVDWNAPFLYGIQISLSLLLVALVYTRVRLTAVKSGKSGGRKGIMSKSRGSWDSAMKR